MIPDSGTQEQAQASALKDGNKKQQQQHLQQRGAPSAASPIPADERSPQQAPRHGRKESHTPKTYMDELPPELFKRVGESDDLLTQAVGAMALLLLWAVWLTGSFSVFWFPYLLVKGASAVLASAPTTYASLNSCLTHTCTHMRRILQDGGRGGGGDGLPVRRAREAVPGLRPLYSLRRRLVQGAKGITYLIAVRSQTRNGRTLQSTNRPASSISLTHARTHAWTPQGGTCLYIEKPVKDIDTSQSVLLCQHPHGLFTYVSSLAAASDARTHHTGTPYPPKYTMNPLSPQTHANLPTGLRPERLGGAHRRARAR